MAEHSQVEALQATFEHEIPLTRQIGLEAVGYDGACLSLRAPLVPNVNHKATAFAGSLNAVATLAGWGLVWLILRERGLRGTIVIHESSSQYRLPVRDDFVAICPLPEAQQIETFVVALQRRGKARLALSVNILDGDRIAVAFKGSYVAFLER
ncbi:MAG TPA: thioesterase domain-containing protein [Ktedonobacterales bacterium]|jgi:thioesterase domain-containing protein|nr:thioesterase domain-containing protein [Ktedonobacterales bacterium]